MKSYLRMPGLLAVGVATCAMALNAQAADPEYRDVHGQIQAQQYEPQPVTGTNAAVGKPGAAELGTQASPTPVTVGANSGGQFFAFAESLFLKPVNDQLHFALLTPTSAITPGGSLPPPGSELASVETDYAPGFRLGLGSKIGTSGMDAAFAFSYLKSKNVSRVTQPAGGQLVAIRFPSTNLNRYADSASGKYNLDNIVLDFEVGQKLNLGSGLGMRLFAGLRYASMKTRLKVTYYGEDFAGPGRVVVMEKSSMAGIGPRFGSSMTWNLPFGLYVGGDAAASLLFGNLDHTTQVEGGGIYILDFDSNDTGQLFPVVESKLALGWQKQFTDRIGLSIESGYRYQVWFSAQGELRIPDADNLQFVDKSRTDIGLHGPFLTASLSF